MPWCNYHSHSNYCDGKQLPEAYLKKAVSEGMPAWGFSAHAPVPFESNWSLSPENLPIYLAEVRQLKIQYADFLQVYCGLEVDFIPNLAGRNLHLNKELELDFYIGSIHFVDFFADGTPWNIDTSPELFLKGLKEIFQNNFRKAATRFYELTWQMIQEECPDIVGHLDKIKMYNANFGFFSETDSWYRLLQEKTLQVIKLSGCRIEVNTRGYYRYQQTDLYPGYRMIEKMARMDIPVVLNSDAHHPDDVCAGFDYAAGMLQKCGLPYLWVLLDGKWQAKKYTASGIVL